MAVSHIRPQTGGMVTSIPGRMIDNNEFQMLKNFIFRDGQWHKRPGIDQLYDSDPGEIADLVIGLFRHYRSDGNKYSIAVDVVDNDSKARLLGKKNDAIGDTDWEVIESTYNQYDVGGDCAYFRAVAFGEKLIMTDGLFAVRYVEEKDADGNWVKGILGALPPKRQPGYSESAWEGDPIFPGGFAQYCYVYAYEDETTGKITLSNPSPATAVIALDWMGKGPDGLLYQKFVEVDPETKESWTICGPTRVTLENLGVGQEYMSSTSDLDTVKRIVRRDIYRRIKRYADELFGSWKKIGSVEIKDSIGGSGFTDQLHNPSSEPLDTDNFPPPKAKYVASHKNHLALFNTISEEIEAPANQGDTTNLPYYEALGLLKRARINVVNNTGRGHTGASIRIKLQWHTAADSDYIAFVPVGGADDDHDIVFVDKDGKTLLPFFRESYLESGWITYENLAGGSFAVGDQIEGDISGAIAIITELDVGNSRVYIESMTGTFTTSDEISCGAVSADVTAVKFNEAIFVVQVPEIMADGEAFFYVFFNANTSVSTDLSNWINTYHRKYASSDLAMLYSMNHDCPMVLEREDHLFYNRMGLDFGSISGGDRYNPWPDNAAPYGNVASQNKSDETCLLINEQSSAYLKFPESLINPENQISATLKEGGFCFFFYPTGNNYEDGHEYYICGGGIQIVYYHNTGGADYKLKVTFTDDNDSTDLFSIDIGSELTENHWYFISAGWNEDDASNNHIYLRMIENDNLSDIIIDQDSALNAICKFQQSAIQIAHGLPFGNNDHNMQGYYDEFVLFKKELSLEEVELAFYRRNLDAYYYDVENRTGSGWGKSGATCSFTVSAAEDVGDASGRNQAQLAISNEENPNVFSYKNRRVIGNPADAGTGIIEFQGNLLCYKEQSVYRVRTDGAVDRWMESDSPVDEAQRIGLIAPMTLDKGMVNGSEVVIGLAANGLYAFTGDDFIEISQPIADILRDLTTEQKQSSIGFYWPKYGVYVLGIGTTDRTCFSAEKVGPDSPTPYVPDTIYLFHLDTLHLQSEKNGERRVRINISKGTTGIDGNAFSLGYPCLWKEGNGDNGEVLFAHSDDDYIYIWGSRTGDSEFLDAWGSGDVNIPVEVKTRRFWYESANFRGFKPFYFAYDLVEAVMTAVRNVLDAVPKTYDELTGTTTTHSTQSNVISGGHNGGKMYLLPRTARGEWLELTFTDSDCEGDVIWDGLAIDVVPLARP